MAKRRLTKQQWRERIAEFRASGLSREEYCAQQELHAKTMVWWERMLVRGGRTVKTATTKRSEFVEVTGAVALGGADHRLELELAGVRVHVPATFDAQALGRVLAVLEARR